MNDVGFLYNCSLKTNPAVRLSPTLVNRVALIDSSLREAGHRLLFYSPRQIRPDTETVLGYRFEDRSFVPATAPIPAVNGNWTYQTRRLLEKGMGYHAFLEWAEERQVSVYVPLPFSELVSNKYQTYALVRGYHESLHPHCEPYRRSLRQLEYFAERGRLTFIKPRSGNKGDRIVTLRRRRKDFQVNYYAAGRHRRFTADSLPAADRQIRELLRGKTRYIIQHAVDVLRHGDRVFDVRVNMLYDGSAWHWVHEGRLSAAGKDISNVSQGGESVATEDLLFDVLGADAADDVLDELRGESFGLAAYLERLHPGDLMEIAFDFVIDTEQRLRLLEINTKPGLVGIGSETTVFDMTPDEEPQFARWVYPHARHLASFLRTKAEER